MSVRASSRFAGVLLAAGLAPAAGAMELGQASAPASAVPTITLPVFLDVDRLADLQDAWRTHFNRSAASATPVSLSGDAEAAAIDQARQTLTRGEQVSRQAAAVRDRAEELSRRFAGDPDGTSAPAPDPAPAPVAPEDTTVTETASIAPAATEAPPAEAVADAPAQLQKVSATINVPAGGDPAPASMLGGPREEDAAASDPAPVIEDMATKPAVPAKRITVAPPPRRVAQTPPEPPGFFASIFPGSSGGEATAPQSDDPDKNPMMPREIRSFGWNAQP